MCAKTLVESLQVFTTGTAVVLCAVGSITYLGEKKCYGTSGEPTPVALELYEALTGLQVRCITVLTASIVFFQASFHFVLPTLQDLRLPDPENWVVPVAGA
jgi:hypothetical protein